MFNARIKLVKIIEKDSGESIDEYEFASMTLGDKFDVIDGKINIEGDMFPYYRKFQDMDDLQRYFTGSSLNGNANFDSTYDLLFILDDDNLI